MAGDCRHRPLCVKSCSEFLFEWNLRERNRGKHLSGSRQIRSTPNSGVAPVALVLASSGRTPFCRKRTSGYLCRNPSRASWVLRAGPKLSLPYRAFFDRIGTALIDSPDRIAILATFDCFRQMDATYRIGIRSSHSCGCNSRTYCDRPQDSRPKASMSPGSNAGSQT